MKKILIIGGANQGKTNWVKDNFSSYQLVPPDMLIEENKKGNFFSGIWLNQFHLTMKQWILEDDDVTSKIDLIRQNTSWVIVSNEIGNGVVPIDKEDRRWREATGRVLCELANDADEVYRVFCGVPLKIK